jgi:hypothetical protein
MDTIDKEEIIDMVLRQTDITREEAIELLETHNYDYMKVIKIAMGIEEKKSPEKIVSLNQQIYKEIRYVMDEASSHYRALQEQKKQNSDFEN